MIIKKIFTEIFSGKPHRNFHRFGEQKYSMENTADHGSVDFPQKQEISVDSFLRFP